MGNLTEEIERWLKERLQKSQKKALEVRRSEIAGLFACVPSQVNYVLRTRFSPEQGYLIESRRGGGGFIRIIQLELDLPERIRRLVGEGIGDAITQAQAERLLCSLAEQGLITRREQRLLATVVAADTLAVELPWRDELRARILKRALPSLLNHDTAG